MSAAELVGRLAHVPARVSRTLAGRAEAEFRRAAPGEGWSAAEIIAHLRASDEIVTYRVYAMLVRENPPMPGYDERRWADVAGFAGADVASSLRLYALRRSELVRTLERIGPEEWKRVGLHEERGTISLQEMLELFVGHEEEHCLQLEAVYSGGESVP